MRDLLKSIVDIGALVIIATALILVVGVLRLNRAKRRGTLGPRALIQMTAVEFLSELGSRGFRNRGQGPLETISSIDGYIDRMRGVYGAESMLGDYDLILRCGSLAGEILRIKGCWKWCFDDGNIPVLEKDGRRLYPYEAVKKKISGEIVNLHDYFAENL